MGERVENKGRINPGFLRNLGITPGDRCPCFHGGEIGQNPDHGSGGRSNEAHFPKLGLRHLLQKNSQALDKVSSLLGFEAFVDFISESLKPFFEYSLDDGQL